MDNETLESGVGSPDTGRGIAFLCWSDEVIAKSGNDEAAGAVGCFGKRSPCLSGWTLVVQTIFEGAGAKSAQLSHQPIRMPPATEARVRERSTRMTWPNGVA